MVAGGHLRLRAARRPEASGLNRLSETSEAALAVCGARDSRREHNGDMRVLVVEDEVALADAIARGLRPNRSMSTSSTTAERDMRRPVTVPTT